MTTLNYIKLVSSLSLLSVFSHLSAAYAQTKLKVTSDFQNGGNLPAVYTCDGYNSSPALQWSGVPPETRSFALIMEDPTITGALWINWIVYNIPGSWRGIPKNYLRGKILGYPNHGFNSWGGDTYGGPCPRSGRHRYVLRLFALDYEINQSSILDRTGLLNIFKDKPPIAEAKIEGFFSRKPGLYESLPIMKKQGMLQGEEE